MGKSTHFLGQPLYGQVIKLLDKAEILEISRKNGGERYIKRFDAWTHLMTMLYAVIMRHDSLREISVSMLLLSLPFSSLNRLNLHFLNLALKSIIRDLKMKSHRPFEEISSR
jgi:hypothetical protein